jgi:hypothetical protein
VALHLVSLLCGTAYIIKYFLGFFSLFRKQLKVHAATRVSMDLLLKMQAGYDAVPVRMHGDQIKVKRFKPNTARL